MKRWLRLLPISMASLALASCTVSPEDDAEIVAEVSQAVVTVPPKGGATTLDIGSWNLEWFGATGNGPVNETLQLQNARDVINGTDLDIWGVVEIVSATQFNQLKSQLPGYAGFLSDDPTVTSGSSYYTAGEQKVGILYKSSIATVQSAKLILTGNDYEFAGRPPLEVKLTATVNGAAVDLVVIVVHAKAMSDTTSYTRRKNGSTALKSYLDTTYPTQNVLVIGDLNDDVDTSITSGKQSPYKNFVDDAANYFFPTKALSDTGQHSTASYPDMIDHHLVTNDVKALYLANSAEVYYLEPYVPSYATTTTDHYPVLSRYALGGSGPPTVQVTSPNGGESWMGNTTHSITWTSSSISNVRLDYTLDGASWINIVPSVAAASGSYSWLLPNTSTISANVKISSALDTTINDTGNGSFAITASGGPAQVFINEILANEPGSVTNGEFVEIVNTGGASADLSGWTVSDATSVRHTFPAGTALAPGAAIMVFGGATGIPSGMANAVAASTGTLSLNNSSDSVILKNGNTVIDTFAYGSSLASTDGVSMNRSPDGTSAGTFVLHTTLNAALSSPSTKVDGTPWGS